MSKERVINVNGQEIRVFDDGSITRLNSRATLRDVRNYGTKNSNGYPVVSIKGRVFSIHRLMAMAFLDGFRSSSVIDHINGDRSNNSINNLRLTTKNSQAYMKPRRGVTSKFRGVSWSKVSSKWHARIQCNKVDSNVGLYKVEEAAAIAYDRRAIKLGFDLQALNLTHNPELSMLAGC